MNKEEENSTNYDGFTLVGGGLIHLIASVLHKKAESIKGSRHLAVVLILITWLPLGLLAVIWGTLNDSNQTISFFQDFFIILDLGISNSNSTVKMRCPL